MRHIPGHPLPFMVAFAAALGSCAGYTPRPAGFERMSHESASSQAMTALAPVPGLPQETASASPDSGLSPPPETTDEATLAIDPSNPRPPNLDKLAGGAMSIAGFAPVHFDHDSAAILVSALDEIRACADYLRRNPQVWIILEGHCDSDGSNEYNYNLGMLRTSAVRQELIALGTGAGRLFMISYGEERPAVEERSEADKAQNRRVEFRAFIAPNTVIISGSADTAGQPPENPAVPTPPPEGEEMP